MLQGGPQTVRRWLSHDVNIGAQWVSTGPVLGVVLMRYPVMATAVVNPSKALQRVLLEMLPAAPLTVRMSSCSHSSTSSIRV